jgi:RNA polymerase sigma-70 factor (family 1)
MSRTGKENSSLKSLLIKLIDHDHSSFQELYDLFSAQIYRNILKMVKDTETAQEILQDVFVKIWEKRHIIDPEKPFVAYLHQIARNLVYDHFRKLALDRKLELHLTVISTDMYSHVEEDLHYKESNRLLMNAIEKLSPQRKQVFTLCKLEGKSYLEVSQMLHISTSTISDHLLKSNKFIKAQMLVSDTLTAIILGLVFWM